MTTAKKSCRKFRYRRFATAPQFTGKTSKGLKSRLAQAISTVVFVVDSLNNQKLSCLLHHKMIEWYRGSYIIAIDEKEIETYRKNKQRQRVKIDPKYLKWIPKDWSKRAR